MKNFIRRIYWAVLKTVGITPEKKNTQFHLNRRQSLIDQYFRANSVRKLQIGAQSNSLPDWLNVDIAPKELSVCYMDATQPFPFPDASFDYVYAEHMIEHIGFEEAVFMVSEIHRILKPGGKVRISTPNLHALAALCINPEKPEHAAYMEQYHSRFFPTLPFDPVFVVNKLFYSFHHRFIHSESSLRYMLELAGFGKIARYEVGESDDPMLQQLEQHWREIGDTANRVETIIAEAEKN